MLNTRALWDWLRRAPAAVGHALLRAVNSLRRLSPTMWLALGLLAAGVALLVTALITSTVIELGGRRAMILSAAACCVLGMGATLWAFVRATARSVELPTNGALRPLAVASAQRPIVSTSTSSFLLRPAHRSDPLFRLGLGAIAMMLVGFVQPLLLVVVTVLGGMALFAARRVLARGTLIVLGAMLAIPPAGLFIGSLLAPLLGIQFGLLLLLVPVAILLLGSTAARRLTINAQSRALVLPQGLVTRGVGVAAVVGLSLVMLVSGRLTPDASLLKGVDAQAQARSSEAAARTTGEIAMAPSPAAAQNSAPTASVPISLVHDWRPSLIAHAPDINLLLALGLVAAIAIGRFGLTGITSKLRTELARCGNSPRGMAAVGLIGLAVLVLGEAQFTSAPALEAKLVGTPASGENLADRESLIGKVKLAEIHVEKLRAAQETNAASAVSGTTRSPIQSHVEIAEAEAELAARKLQLARWDLQAAKTGTTVAGTVDLSTWGRTDPQPAP
jgi:hypothetical protein